MPLSCIFLCCGHFLVLVKYSVTNDDDQTDCRDDDRRRHAKAEVAPEGEVVPEELRPPRLFTDDQVCS